MLTLEEQYVFLKEQRNRQIKFLKLLSKQFGEQNKDMFTEQIDHTNFCYDSILSSLYILQSLAKTHHEK